MPVLSSTRRNGEPLEFYLWFVYEFCLFTIKYRQNIAWNLATVSKLTIGQSINNLPSMAKLNLASFKALQILLL
ncbi:hypothetical protein C5O78_06835 [Treponema phagedenis]|nr:hypothetical protein C5O78_06835 [Treponema phagedenis]